jgi:ABC-type transport system substrate-binding protein
MLIAIFLTLLSITSMGPLPAEGYDTNREELKFTILTLAGSQDSVTGGAMIAFDLSEIGFDMTMKVEESSVMYQKIEDYGYYENSQSYDNEEDPVDEVRPYDMIYMGLSSSTMFPTGLYSLCHTKRDYRGGDNQWGVHNATLDGHLDWMLNGTIL